jgi:molecular chaperone DnaK (HSP70)
VTREELEPFVKAMREEVSSAAEDYLTEAQQRGQIARDSIRFILIGGGGSALPEIGSTLRKTMPGAELLPLSASVATSLVQRGAAFYGCDSTLYDRRSIRSYGVVTFRSEKPPYPVTERDIDHGDPDAQGTRETFYPWYEVYVERNQIVRAGDQFTRDFNPLRANQSEVKFEVLEGEDQNPRAKANTHVGEVVLPLPRHAKQTYRTNCAFTIGKDNLLLVRAEGENGKVVEQAMVWQADTLDE